MEPLPLVKALRRSLHPSRRRNPKHCCRSHFLLLIVLFILTTTSAYPTQSSTTTKVSSLSLTRQERPPPEKRDTTGCSIDFDSSCKNQACFVFLDEDPFVILPPEERRSPKIFKKLESFPCKDFRKNDIEGVSFQLLEKFFRDPPKSLSVSDDDYYRCYYGGDNCGWNTLVNYVTFGGRTYEEKEANSTPANQLVLLGSLLETPSRLRMDSSASVSYADDFLVVVGRTGDVHEGLFQTIVGPLDAFVWIMVICTCAVAFLTGLLIKYSDPSRENVLHKKTKGKAEWMKVHCLDSVIAALAHLTDKEEIAGAAPGAQDSQRFLHVPAKSKHRDQRSDSAASLSNHDLEEQARTPSRNSTGMTTSMYQRRVRISFRVASHVFVRVLFQITLTLFIGIALLLYEAALTNFLFQQSTPKLEQKVTALTREELSEYSVLANSAVNNVWVQLQEANDNLKDRKDKPWTDCRDIDTCFRELKTGKHNFLVVQDTVARFKIKNDSSCNELSIFQTEESFFDFNAGLIYGPDTKPKLRKEMDLTFLNSRVSGRSKRIYDKFLENTECRREVNSITWRVYIIPTVLVCGAVSVLILIQVVLIYTNHRELQRIRKEEYEENAREGKETEDLQRESSSSSVTHEFLSDDTTRNVANHGPYINGGGSESEKVGQ